MKVRRVGGACVGLDLSLTGSAACALPHNWTHDLRAVRMMPMAGYKLTKEATATEKRERIITIRDTVLAFFKQVQGRRAQIEDYAFSRVGQLAALGELAGVVKLDIWENWGVSVEPINASRARAILLQKLPKKDSKLFTQVNVRRLGGPALTWNDDEIDAFVVANACLMNAGGVAMTFKGEW